MARGARLLNRLKERSGLDTPYVTAEMKVICSNATVTGKWNPYVVKIACNNNSRNHQAQPSINCILSL
jgi:hypothetical protein